RPRSGPTRAARQGRRSPRARRTPRGNSPQLGERAMDFLSIAKTELLQVADAVARDKGIERDEVLEAMEQAIGKAGRAKYGHEHDIRAAIDRKTGEIRLMRYREVADHVENEFTQISLADARVRKPDAAVGTFLID